MFNIVEYMYFISILTRKHNDIAMPDRAHRMPYEIIARCWVRAAHQYQYFEKYLHLPITPSPALTLVKSVEMVYGAGED